MEDKPQPECADVILFNSTELKAKMSGVIQKRIDPDAKSADRTFGHVAIALDNILALEAVSADPAVEVKQQFKLPYTVELGKWSQSELGGGVRLIPIADLVIPAMRDGTELIALRPPNASDDMRSTLSPVNPFILGFIGSQYSIVELKEKAGFTFGERLTRLVASKYDWTSVPTDFATRVDLDPELRKQIATTLPEYMLPETARTFYCSQAVIACLRAANLLDAGITTALTTPTGLCQLLLKRNWRDSTVVYRCAPDADQYLNRSPLAHAASYTQALAMIELGLQSLAFDYGVRFIEASIEYMNQFLEDILRRPSISGTRVSSASEKPEKSNQHCLP